MSMQIMCTKGCGESIEVTDEMLDEARRLGVPLNVQHDVCPKDDPGPQPKYRAVIEVYRHAYVGVPEMPDESDENWIEAYTLWRQAREKIDDKGYEIVGEKIAGSGSEHYGPSFVAVFDELTKGLSEEWQRVADIRHIAESD